MAKEQREIAPMNEAKRRTPSKGSRTAHQKDAQREWMSEESRDTGRRQGTGTRSTKRPAGADVIDRETTRVGKPRRGPAEDDIL
jgi:hypothetical protein